jgi:hypothetical protein
MTFLRHKTYGPFESSFLRQSLPPQQSPRPFGTAEKHRKRRLLRTKLLTVASARNAVLVSLSPVVSKAPDIAVLVRNFKGLILNGYSTQEFGVFRISLAVRGALRWKYGQDVGSLNERSCD